MKELLTRLWPLHRTLVSDGTDEALRITGEHMPSASRYEVETYTPGTPAWTWRVPERFVVDEAYLEVVGGERVADFAVNPLHLVSYALPIDKVLTWDELEPHLFFSASRPDAIPWEFRYYERSWGFCVTKRRYDDLPRDAKYRAVIRSRFVTDAADGLRLSVATLEPDGGETDAGEILVCSHVCHVRQANDDLSGVVSMVELANRLADRPLPAGSMTVRFLFVPETIGSICYFSRHEDFISRMKAGIFLEMTGNRGMLRLQRSRQDDHLIDRVARDVLRKRGTEFGEDGFRKVIANDEMVINGPGVNVPCISLSRWPYPEYHTSDDNPDIIFEDMLVEAVDVAEETIRAFATNYVPRRIFKGPIFLSGHGLWVDWRTNPKLNNALEQIMLRLEGDHSVYDIASELDLDYAETHAYIERFRAASLVERLPIRSTASGVSAEGRG